MEVKSLVYNWRQAGSTIDRDGAGEDYEKVTVGERGVIDIKENAPSNGLEVWNYFVTKSDGSGFRIFNPNFVEYNTKDK